MEHSFKFSAIALIDVLGFKSLAWQRDPVKVAAALDAARKAIDNLTKWMETDDASHLNILGGRPVVRVSWFSDTICVVSQLPDPSQMQRKLDDTDNTVRAALVEVVIRAVGMTIRDAAEAATPLIFRGVIHVGELFVDGNIYIGPAINEAQELYEQAQGAFVWLTPAAARLPYHDVGQDHQGLVWYDVPTKMGTLRTRVVSPFFYAAPEHVGPPICHGFEVVMDSDKVDVVVKRQNTRAFLRKLMANDVDLHDSPPEALDGLEAQLLRYQSDEDPLSTPSDG
jgi:hypothetical protein